MDSRRFEVEKYEMRQLLPGFKLQRYVTSSANNWSSYEWEGRAPSGHLLTARYPEDYPYSQLKIKSSPKLDTHHYLHGYLCLMKDWAWSPDWTAATNILIAFRFIREYRTGVVRG